MNDIRDIRPPVETPLWVWVLGIVLVCALAAALYFFLRRRKEIVPVPAIPVPARPAGDIALDQLEALQHLKYPEKGMFKPFYSTLSDIIRRYLEARFNIKAPEMTTEEFLVFAGNGSALSGEHKKILKDFLNGCDMVKFAKHQPTANEAQLNFDLAKELVLETKDGI